MKFICLALMVIHLLGCSRPAEIVVPPVPQPAPPPTAGPTPEQLYVSYLSEVSGSKIYALPSWKPLVDRDLYFYRGLDHPEQIPEMLDAALAAIQPFFPEPLVRPFWFFTVTVPPDSIGETDKYMGSCFFTDSLAVGDYAAGHECVFGDAYTADWPWIVFLVERPASWPDARWIGLIQHEYQHLGWSQNDKARRCQLPDGRTIWLHTALGHGSDCDPLKIGKIPPLFIPNIEVTK